MTLPTAGFGEAVVALPVGATRSMPVVVAVLGIGDTPEEQCATWQELVGPLAFVLCPRGAKNMVVDEPEAGEAPPIEGEVEGAGEGEGAQAAAPIDPTARAHQVGYYPVDLPTLDREVSSSLTALKARYGAHVADADVVYAGFSRGAYLGASLAMKHPERFQRVVLIEGGHSPWQVEGAAAFARGGGKKVLFACGQQPCIDDAERTAQTLRSQGVDVRVAVGAGEGHGYKKQVKEELRRALDWVVDGAPAWRSR